MGVLILKAGLMDTLQDQGRWGFASWGVNTGGAADPFASATANLLLGNSWDATLLEIHFPALHLKFEKSCWFTITGADFTPSLNGFTVAMNKPVYAAENDQLTFKRTIWGARAYLAIKGGFSTPKWLGSSSTNLKLPELGLLGRRLKDGDRIPFESDLIYSSKHQMNNWFISNDTPYSNWIELRVLPGREWDWLDNESQNRLQEEEFIIQPQSDRMGYRLMGTPVTPTFKKELVSTGVRNGTVQLLPNGQLIILMVDHQTTGGYPRLLEIIAADLPKLAQLKQGNLFHFKMVDCDLAEQVFHEQQQLLKAWTWACYFKWNK